MKFQKGHKKIGGRRKGTPNKKKLASVHDYLAERNMHPVRKILECMRKMKPEEKIRIWFQLLEFTFPKPKQVAVEAEIIDEGLQETQAVLLNIPSDVLTAAVKASERGQDE